MLSKNGFDYGNQHILVMLDDIALGEMFLSNDRLDTLSWYTEHDPLFHKGTPLNQTFDKQTEEMSIRFFNHRATPEKRVGYREWAEGHGMKVYCPLDQFFVTRGRCDTDPHRRFLFVGEDITEECLQEMKKSVAITVEEVRTE